MHDRKSVPWFQHYTTIRRTKIVDGENGGWTGITLLKRYGSLIDGLTLITEIVAGGGGDGGASIPVQ